MHLKLSYVVVAGALCFLLLTGGCSGSQEPVVIKEFALAELNSIKIDYDGESVIIKESISEKVTVLEYLNKDRAKYFAEIDLRGGELNITEGARPIGNGVRSCLEIYVPASYRGSISVHTTDGKIQSCVALSLAQFRADTTNGAVEISNLSAQKVAASSRGGEVWLKNMNCRTCEIETTNGNVRLDNVEGAVAFHTKNGDLTARGLRGNGSFQAGGDGNLDVQFTVLSADVEARAKNGNIFLTIPGGQLFALEASSRNGSIKTPFPELPVEGHSVKGDVGPGAAINIMLDTGNGDIEIQETSVSGTE